MIQNVPQASPRLASGIRSARVVMNGTKPQTRRSSKGSLHTDELMQEIVAKETGLRTGRRISHVFVVDVPTCPRPLFITDAAINIAPDLAATRDIVQNAIDLAHTSAPAPLCARCVADGASRPRWASPLWRSSGIPATEMILASVFRSGGGATPTASSNRRRGRIRTLAHREALSCLTSS
jgi:hypothetical protein